MARMPTDTMTTTKVIKAMRFNEAKPKLSYLLTMPNAVQGVAKVFEYGADKYAPHNWKNGMPFTEVADSALRHLTAFLAGEDNDPEFGLPHTDHALWNLMALAEYHRTHSQFDNRPKIEGAQA